MNVRKKIMIIGGGIRQMQLIEAAKKEGYYLVICDRTSSCLGASYADVFYEVDIMDREALIEVAKKEKIDGVISNSELAMMNVAAVSRAVKVVGNPVEAVEALQSKNRFRKVQFQCGVFAPLHYETKSFDEVKESITKMHYPIIIKPSECSGTRGTTRIDSPANSEEMKRAFEKCQKFSRNDYVTIEEYVEMPSLDVIESDILLYKGEIIWEGTMRTRRSERLPMVPMTYSFPCGFDEESMKVFKDVITRILKEAKMEHGQFNVEAYFTPEKELFVIEINARQGGNGIPEIIKIHSGIDMNRLLVTTTVDDAIYFNEVKHMQIPNHYSIRHLVLPEKSGIYKGVEIDERIQKYVVGVQDVIKKNHEIQVTGDASDNVCAVNMVFEDEATHKWAIDNMEQLIKPVIE